MSDDIREALQKSIDAGSTIPEKEEVVNEGVATEDEPEVVGDADATKEGAPGSEQANGETEVDEGEDKDEEIQGKEKTPEDDKPKVKEKTLPIERAPVSWKAGAKERWKELPEDVRREVLRRERDIDARLRQAADKGKFADNFYRVIEPYRAVMAAEGVQDPIVAVQNLMQTATNLRLGTPNQKADVIATLIQVYGVDIQTLDNILSGRVNPNNDPVQNLERVIDERLKPVNDLINQGRQQESYRQEQLRNEAAQTVQDFADSAEFFEELRQDMGDLMDLATRRGRQLTLQQAYDQAARNHPEISKILNQRQQAAENKKRAAGSSIRGTPSGAPKNELPDDDIVAHIKAAMGRTN